MPLFLILLTVPMIEIALFIVIGDRIGLMATLATVVVTAIIGTTALRMQGFAVLQRAQSAARPEDLSDLLIDGLCLFAAGLLLLTPGFLTDAIGFLLLIPPVRRAIAKRIARNMVQRVVFTNRTAGADPSASGGYSAHPGAGAAEPPPRRPTAGAGGPRPASPWSHQDDEPPRPDSGAEDAVVLDETPPKDPGDHGRR